MKLLTGMACALAATAAMAVLPLAAAQADTVWLCPGPSAPCAGSMATTWVTSSGTSRVTDPGLPADPPVDCFYVYPTVSEQPGPNADKSIDPPIVSIAEYQAARFSEVCKVYAPVYRQVTLAAITGGAPKSAWKIAYRDVRDAWRDYLSTHNGGRGVVLIGHSQGAGMLRQLIAKEIDPRASERRRLVSALLIGGDILVRKGKTSGGDFRHVKACTKSSQVGCVVGYSLFDRPVPKNSYFGRIGPRDRVPKKGKYEVMCTNPAALGGGSGKFKTLTRTEPIPGLLGIAANILYGGVAPTADTPWLQPKDHYRGKCVTSKGAHVLMVKPVAGARSLNPSPTPEWGLHLVDINLPLGNLVDLVRSQSRSYAAR